MQRHKKDVPQNEMREDEYSSLLNKETATKETRQETALFKQLERHRQCVEKTQKMLCGDTNPTPTERERISKIITECERQLQEVRNKLAECKLRLVASIAQKYRHCGVPVSDLIQEGSIGLLKAVEKFDIRRNCKFSTYATWWIQQSITRSIANQRRTIRLPVYVVEELHRLDKIFRERDGEDTPAFEKLARETRLPKHTLISALAQVEGTISLETPVAQGKDIADIVEDESACMDTQLEENEMRVEIQRQVNSLPPREACVLKLRFGIGDDEPHTLVEISKKLKISKEWARIILENALNKLRHPSRIRRLRDY